MDRPSKYTREAHQLQSLNLDLLVNQFHYQILQKQIVCLEADYVNLHGFVFPFLYFTALTALVGTPELNLPSSRRGSRTFNDYGSIIIIRVGIDFRTGPSRISEAFIQRIS